MMIVPGQISAARNLLSPSYHADLFELIAQACRMTQAYYVTEQQADGYWWYELESKVTITAEYLMLFHFVGIKDEERDKKIARYILRHQTTEGTWGTHYG